MTKSDTSSHGISLVEAVETLSNIADLELDRNIGVTQRHDINILGNHIIYRTIHWLEEADAESTVMQVKEIFRVVLHYLRDFYKQEYPYVANKKTLEGVKAIMVLVSEAAKKLDLYTTLFQNDKLKSVSELREYKELQEFYRSRIARQIDEGTLGKWILGLTRDTMERKKMREIPGNQSTDTKKIFIDLDSVKKDTEYELFYLRKEDGSRFFSPRLIRNIKLVCDFGEYFREPARDDPLSDMAIWRDHYFQTAAKNIFQSIGPSMDWFYQESSKFPQRQLVQYVNKALMAILLSSNPSNLVNNHPQKTCMEYFHDFQVFLRAALDTDDYQKLITNNKKRSNKASHHLIFMIHSLCKSLYMKVQAWQEMIGMSANLINEAKESFPVHIDKLKHEDHPISNRLEEDYEAMSKLIKNHPSGPLNMVLQVLEHGGYQTFDPMLHLDIPNMLYSLDCQEHRMTNIHLPSPTLQEYIQKANVIEESKAFLRSYVEPGEEKKHLMFNMQDRTSWREHFRCRALEELHENPNFKELLTVVTLPKDTEFYNQHAPYQHDNQAKNFKESLKEQFSDDNCGFYIPQEIKKQLTPDIIDGLIEAIHSIFFSSKNMLMRKSRLDFIELFYLFLELKIIELVKPESFSFTCKDGIDIGGAASVELFAFLKLISNETITEEEIEYLNMMLYTGSLLYRERIMLPDRFHRMESLLTTVEHIRHEHGVKSFSKIIHEAFGKFYKTPILDSILIYPHHIVQAA